MLLSDLRTLFSNSICPIEKSYEANGFIFRQGTTVEGIFAIEEGQIKLERYTNEGKEIRIHQAREKECFAEASLFSDKYDCYAIATIPSRLALFPKDEVLNAFREHPDTAIKYINLLSNQVKILRTNLELRTILTAKERILTYLFLFADPETKTVKLPFTLKDISAQLGLAHETLYRELKKLEQESIIERNENEIKLLDSV